MTLLKLNAEERETHTISIKSDIYQLADNEFHWIALHLGGSGWRANGVATTPAEAHRQISNAVTSALSEGEPDCEIGDESLIERWHHDMPRDGDER